MNKIFGLFIFGLASIWLLVWILVLGFQTRSLGDALTLGGAFSPFESGYDILFTFGFPLILVLAFAVLAFTLIIK